MISTFKYCCRGRAAKLERENIGYACLAKVVRDGGFKIAVIVRLSIVPGHCTFYSKIPEIVFVADASFQSRQRYFRRVAWASSLLSSLRFSRCPSSSLGFTWEQCSKNRDPMEALHRQRARRRLSMPSSWARPFSLLSRQCGTSSGR